MKTAIAILTLALAAFVAPAQGATSPGVNLKISGGPEDDVFRVTVSSDGRTYEIESNVPLAADSTICWSAEATGKYVLRCRANAIAGFEISGGAGDDKIVLYRIPVPATLVGGSGADYLEGGKSPDWLQGGPGNDRLVGDGGGDVLSGEGGSDRVIGGMGKDRIDGGGGNDFLLGGAGADELQGGAGNDMLNGGPGDDTLVGGPGRDLLFGGPGRDVETH